MGRYKHRLVSKAREHTERHLSDVIHCQELRNFRIRLHKEMRGVETFSRDRNSAWVCMEGEPMALGWIGYGDYQTSKSGNPKYVVYARGISNMKYSDYTDQFYMRMAVNMDTAVKHARGYLCKYSTDEIAQVFAKDLKTNVRQIKGAADDAYSEAKKNVGIKNSGFRDGMDSRLMAELFNMVHAGHTFADGELDTNIRTLMAKKKESDRFSGKTTPVDFLRTYKHYDGMRVDIARIEDVTSYNLKPMYEHKHTYLLEDLPEEYAGKAAVMSMCEDNQFVEGVGYRVSDSMFYFYVEDVTT